MKKIIIILLIILCSITVCNAQNDSDRTFDTFAIVSRAKADDVLIYFDSLKSPKLLYSILNKDYYVLVRDEKNYIEYYIKTDNDNKIIEIRILKRTNRENKELSQLNPFELQNFHSEFITKVYDAKYIRGYSSYFVIKDENRKRYGEFCLSVFTLPIPIDVKLYGYLVKRLSEQMSKNHN